MRSILGLLLFFMISSPHAYATLSIPNNLTDGEQELILQILGFGSSFRAINNPYPLGGYSGFEAGIGVSSLSTGDIGYFGSRSTVNKNLVYPQLTFAKGVFDSIDLFFSFAPTNENTGVSLYSGALRWGFFQATFLPACFSLLFSATNSNFNDLMIFQTFGVDLVTGVNIAPLSFYVGAGTLYGQGQFDATITSNGAKTNQVGKTFHSLLGLSVEVSDFFAAIQIDQYNATVASLRAGVRF
ncbi:MAG: hypothetical protein IT289_04120 [Oligoflexia bacterium]|nr:hypothetical protein [Oligoflexia bacterium]